MTTPQVPLDSPFGYRSTAAEVMAGVNLAGTIAIGSDCNIAAPWVEGQPPHAGVHPHVRDAGAAADWWAASEHMTGVRFSAG